jgi:(p)ppGpp synthase/HD superfamily hydrolase
VKVQLVAQTFLTPTGSPAPRNLDQPQDRFSPATEIRTPSLSTEQVSMLRHGLALAPELTGSADLLSTLRSHGLEKLWPKVQEAYLFAKGAHGPQRRDDGTPYYHHCARTATIAIEQFGVRDLHTIQAALLHDVLEDTQVKPEEIERRFGPETVKMVSLMSKPEKQPDETYDQRNERYVARLESAGSLDLIALKLSDRTDNIHDTHLMPDKVKIRRYLKDTRDHYVPLAERHFPGAAESLRSNLAKIESWLGDTAAA